MIPGRTWPDDGHRPQGADAQTTHFIAQHAGVAAQAQFAKPLLQEQPGFMAGGAVTALGFIRVGAEEYLPARFKPAQPRQRALGKLKLSRIDRCGQGSAPLAHDPGDLGGDHPLNQGRQVLVEPFSQRRTEQFAGQPFERGFARADDLRRHARFGQHGQGR